MNFAREDAADDLRLNAVVWRSVKGADSLMPAPTRAAFVRGRVDDDDWHGSDSFMASATVA